MKKAIQNKKSGSRSNPFFKKNNSSDFFPPQTKMQVNEPGDVFEQEADEAADQVLEKKEGSAHISGAGGIQKQSLDENIQEKPAFPTITPLVQTMEEEPETVQKQEEDLQRETAEDLQAQEEEEELQMANDEGMEDLQMEREEDVQTQEEEEEELQTKRTGHDSRSVSPGVEHGISSSKGMGSPLPDSSRKQMESGFGADFSRVRVHTDSQAVQMNKAVGAQAFTHGNDIYFNEGKFNPASRSGQHLLAHELTHTLQQGGTGPVQGKLIQKDEGEAQAAPLTEFGLPDGTTIDTATSPGQMILPTISFPSFKNRNADRFPLNMDLRRGERPSTVQVPLWRNEMRPSVTSRVDEILNGARNEFGYGAGDDTTYFLKPSNNKPLRVFGNRDSLIETFLIPFWDREAEPASFQVDHINEHQLGGDDDIYNYELLDATANGSAGPTIAAEIRRRIKHAVDNIRQDPVQAPDFTSRFNYGTSAEEITRLKNDYQITFTEREFTKDVSGNPGVYWGILETVENQHIDLLQVMSPAELQEEGLEGGNPDHLMIFPGGGGGVPVRIPWGADQPLNSYVDLSSSNMALFSESRLTLFGASYNPEGATASGNVGFLRVEAFKADGNTLLQVNGNSTFDWQLDAVPGMEYGGAINRESVAASVRNSLRLPGLSPIEISEAYIDPNKGIMATGKVLPTVPFISDADIDIVVEGDSVRLRKLFNTGEFNMPSPFQLSDSSLEVFIGTEGIGVEGRIDFGIDQVGEGHIGATASTSGGVELEGAFNFDSELFNPAEISVEYKENIWTIGGRIGIPEGKIRGIKSATITANYSENTFSAEGDAELDIPGIERGSMSITYGEEGFSIGGNFNLSSEVPGIRGGNVEARVSKSSDSDGYNVFVSGTADPDIPGITSRLSVTYDNGALTITGTAAYRRGMLSGTLSVGATNRTLDDDGQPTGEPDNTMRVYGGGTLTLQLTPWLAATAGVNFLPNGEMEVTARLATDTYTVFARKEYNKNLFTVPTIEIPLFAIPLGPRSVGLVAQIGGGLDFKAGFGPGQLKNLSAEITYNPDHEEETTVRGHGEFIIPADAGLVLRGDLSLGVSVAIASLSGGIELAGTLGLEGEAGAEVDVNWSPQTGLTLDARGRVMVNPKFTFDVNAFARATLGVGWFSVSETWRHNLASFSWGPDIQFGIIFPIHYEEGQPFDMSLDDLEVIYPNIQVVEMAKGLARDVKNDLFD